LKTQLLICLVVIGILPAFKKAEAHSTEPLCLPVKYRHHDKSIIASAEVPGKHYIIRAKKSTANEINSSLSAKPVALDSVTKLLRLKLYIDQYNYDDIVIGFNAGASPAYNFNEDSKYLQGIDAAEGLSSFSSDGVPLSINLLPLPKQTADVIRLDVKAQNSGPITLKRTELDQLPAIYEVWLIDNYKKDSLDLRADSNYAFTINKSDTASFGSNRFEVVVRQNPALSVQLLDFNASKANDGAQITWTTQNEEDYTHFAVERSSDGGTTFSVMDGMISNGQGGYTYTDKTPPEASDQYRLKITDLNGTATYSNVVTVMYGNTVNTISGAISIYPNPTSGVINLSISQNEGSVSDLGVQSFGTASSLASNSSNSSSYNIRIVNTSGATIKTANSSTAKWQDNVAALSPGTYIITVISNSNNKLVGRSTFVKL